MKTSDLIDKSQLIAMLNRGEGRDITADIINLLCNKLELAHEDLWRDCSTCLYRNTQKCKSCHLSASEKYRPTNWQWRGDME